MSHHDYRHQRLAHPRKVKIRVCTLLPLTRDSCTKHGLGSIFPQRPHSRRRRTISARRHGITADVLLRSIAKHPIPFLPHAAQRRRVILRFSILIPFTGEPGLLSAWLSWRARFVLVLPCCHRLPLPCLAALLHQRPFQCKRRDQRRNHNHDNNRAESRGADHRFVNTCRRR